MTCAVEGCEKHRKPGGSRMCSMHVARKHRRGTTDPGPRGIPRETRFWKLVDKSGDCWTWMGSISNQGYGRYGPLYAHRLSWEYAHGAPVPDGMVIDHTCFERRCVNPEHLQVVTMAENNQNHQGPRRNNKSGIRGVCWSTAMNKWQARAEHLGQVETAYFSEIEDAAAEVVRMRNRLHTNNLRDRVS